MKNEFDVIVVGAGPAGSMAARYAAIGGAKTAILERKKDVGLPVRCGEAVGAKGTSLSVDLKKEWILTQVPKMDMVSPSGHRVTINYREKDKSFVIDRSKMEPDLVDIAVENGCKYYNETNVEDASRAEDGYYHLVTNKGTFTCKILILAEGVEARLGRKFGWRDPLALDDLETCAICRVKHENVKNDTFELYPGSNRAPGGFVWVFPRGNNEANVGLGILGSFAKAGSPREYLKKFVDEKFPGAQISHENCAGVPVGKWLNPLVRDGVMIVGDAARQVNPLNGGGIAYGLYAGRVAGECAAEAIEGETIHYKVLKNYQKKWASYCGKQQLRQFAMKTLLLKKQNDAFMDRIALSLIKEDPDKMNYFRVFAKTFIKHPLILIKTFLVFR